MNDDASKMMSGPAGRVLPRPGRRVVRRSLVVARHCGLRPEDVMLMCYPKSGSTWLRFMVAQALTSQEIDFDSVRRVAPRLGKQRGAPELFGQVVWSRVTSHGARSPVPQLVRFT